MLVQGYNDMKPFLPSVEMKGTPHIFDDALEVAQESLVLEILGCGLEADLEEFADKDKKLLRLCQRAISLSAFLKVIPDLDLVLTDAGFAVVNNEKVTMASRDRVEALRNGTAVKLDDAKDAVVDYLVRTAAYDYWRESEPFSQLVGALMLSFRDFKSAAVYSNATADAFPRSWTEFHDLLPAMNVALMTEAASYISEEYALELVDKLRDRTPMNAAEKKVLHSLKVALAYSVTGDSESARKTILATYSFMKGAPAQFPTFAASAEARAVMITHDDSPIFSLF